MAFDSQSWRCVEAVPAFLFSVDGMALRESEPHHRGWVTVAEGDVVDVGSHHLALSTDAALAYSLPHRVKLRGLRGRRVQVTLHDEPGFGGPRAQTLSIAAEGQTLVVARFGPAGQVHALGSGARVSTALSQRRAGPMTMGDDRMQYMLRVGHAVPVAFGGREFFVHFAARDALDYVAYVVAERSLWAAR